jgi:3-methyladenine DNA glycosylase AlkD
VTGLSELRAELAAAADPARAVALRRYLQMRPGGYAEGDDALGITVPVQRRIAGRYWRRIGLDEVGTLLAQGVHEERLTALLILVRRFRAGDEAERRAVFDLVLARSARVDNWDLVDLVAPHVVGPWLAARDRGVLDRLAASDCLWQRRMAVVATLAFIRDGEFADTLRLAELLLDDPEPLVHKAVGWMLREIGNRDRAVAEAFLARHQGVMPRVMLRYAIEKFEPEARRRYLRGALSPSPGTRQG